MTPTLKTQRAMLRDAIIVCACNNTDRQCEECRNEYDRAQLLRAAKARLAVTP